MTKDDEKESPRPSSVRPKMFSRERDVEKSPAKASADKSAHETSADSDDDNAEKRTPRQWAEQLGNIHKRDPRLPQSRDFADWKHAVADKLHGWSKHAYHFQDQPLLISKAVYLDALEAAAEYPVKPAHEAALAPHLSKETR